MSHSSPPPKGKTQHLLLKQAKEHMLMRGLTFSKEINMAIITLVGEEALGVVLLRLRVEIKEVVQHMRHATHSLPAPVFSSR